MPTYVLTIDTDAGKAEMDVWWARILNDHAPPGLDTWQMQEAEDEQFAVIAGDPLHGFTVVGPFATQDDALWEIALDDERRTPAWVIPLSKR